MNVQVFALGNYAGQSGNQSVLLGFRDQLTAMLLDNRRRLHASRLARRVLEALDCFPSRGGLLLKLGLAMPNVAYPRRSLLSAMAAFGILAPLPGHGRSTDPDGEDGHRLGEHERDDSEPVTHHTIWRGLQGAARIAQRVARIGDYLDVARYARTREERQAGLKRALFETRTLRTPLNRLMQQFLLAEESIGTNGGSADVGLLQTTLLELQKAIEEVQIRELKDQIDFSMEGLDGIHSKAERLISGILKKSDEYDPRNCTVCGNWKG